MIVIDFEWNCGYDKTPLEEILQIGAVRLERLGGPIKDTFCAFVHPSVHRKMNRSAKALPELQASYDSKLKFSDALKEFLDWCGDDLVFADWGGDDFEVLRQNCKYWNLDLPEPKELIDLQSAFSWRAGCDQSIALHRAVEYCLIPDSFTFHNALNDAVYTALLSAWVDPDSLSFLALPKEIRRLSKAPVFPPQPSHTAGPYVSLNTALSGKATRRQACPICGEPVWVRKWFTDDRKHFYGDLRCKTHGSVVCRLSLSLDAQGHWVGDVTIPQITPALLTSYHHAIQGTSISCVKGKSHYKSGQHWKNRRNPAKIS